MTTSDSPMPLSHQYFAGLYFESPQFWRRLRFRLDETPPPQCCQSVWQRRPCPTSAPTSDQRHQHRHRPSTMPSRPPLPAPCAETTGCPPPDRRASPCALVTMAPPHHPTHVDHSDSGCDKTTTIRRAAPAGAELSALGAQSPSAQKSLRLWGGDSAQRLVSSQSPTALQDYQDVRGAPSNSMDAGDLPAPRTVSAAPPRPTGNRPARRAHRLASLPITTLGMARQPHLFLRRFWGRPFLFLH